MSRYATRWPPPQKKSQKSNSYPPLRLTFFGQKNINCLCLIGNLWQLVRRSARRHSIELCLGLPRPLFFIEMASRMSLWHLEEREIEKSLFFTKHFPKKKKKEKKTSFTLALVTCFLLMGFFDFFGIFWHFLGPAYSYILVIGGFRKRIRSK